MTTNTASRKHAGAPLRVLLWSPKGAGLHYGAPGMNAYRLYRSAPPNRFEVSLAHGWPQQQDYKLFASQHFLSPISLRPLDQMRFLRNARRWLEAHASSFDVFHGVQAFHLTVSPACEAQSRGLPAVVKVAAHEFDLADKNRLKWLLGFARRRRRMVRRLGAVIAISGLIADELRGYGVPESRIARIPNGVDTETFQPVGSAAEQRDLRGRLGWRDVPTVAFVGQIITRKRPHLLVEALKLLTQKRIDCQLVFVGPVNEAPYHRDIVTRAAELGVTDRIVWTPFTSEVADCCRAADVFSLPSANEGMPNALLEAMACGLPAVVTPISGMVDLVRDGAEGTHVDARPEALADAIGRYLTDTKTARAHGVNARRLIEDRFSTRVVLDAHERLFRRLVAGENAAG